MNNTERANAAAEDIRISEANTGYALSCDEIREMILKHFPDDGWIPVCPETMPEIGTRVLFFAPMCYGAELGIWSGTHWMCDRGKFSGAEVNHWQPLPAPPKEGATK